MNYQQFYLLFLCYLSSTNMEHGKAQCIVSTPSSGTYQGTSKRSALTLQPFCDFLGIRYAKAPQGDLRFKFPVLAPPLAAGEVYNATQNGSPCVQVDPSVGLVGKEDCLFLNIFTPQPPTNCSQELKPVLVFVHPGGFFYGSGTSKRFSADFIIKDGIILVTLNYRLNVFGFLNYNTTECGGNMGLRDIVVALEWIKINIKSFGGDPNRITLSGESAGALAVALVALSPLSIDLIHGVISQSPVYQEWLSLDVQRVSLDFAVLVGYNDSLSDPDKIVSYLRSLSAEKLQTGFQSYMTERQTNLLTASQPFLPSWDYSLGDAAFFPSKSMAELGKNVPNIPFIAGQNDLDGGFVFNAQQLEQIVSSIRQNLALYFPAYTKEELARVKNYYFGDETDFLKLLIAAINVVTDSVFFYFYQNFSLFKSSLCNNNIFSYQYRYSGNLNKYNVNSLGNYSSKIEGAVHGEELFYLYYSEMDYPKLIEGTTLNATDKRISDELTFLWSNFAKTGNPNSINDNVNVVWEPITAAYKSYLQIDEDTVFINNTRIDEIRRTVLDSFLSYPKNDNNPCYCRKSSSMNGFRFPFSYRNGVNVHVNV